jgi:hypothetical protein
MTRIRPGAQITESAATAAACARPVIVDDRKAEHIVFAW